MTNGQIVSLVNAGVLGVTAHDLEAKQAYQVLLFVRAIRKLRDEIKEKQEAIKDDPQRDGLMREMANEEITLPSFEPLTFEQYHILARENRSVPVPLENGGVAFGDPFSVGMDFLEGVLWK